MAGCSRNNDYMSSQFQGFPGGFPFVGSCGGLPGMIENFQPFLTSLIADNPQIMEELIKPISAVLVAATKDSENPVKNEQKIEKLKTVDEVVLTSDKFQINLNIDGFTPEELSVKTVDNFITIEGKHEEKSENSTVSRSFSKKWAIPEGVKPEEIKCNFNLKEGLLQLEAPRITKVEDQEKEELIPIKIN